MKLFKAKMRACEGSHFYYVLLALKLVVLQLLRMHT